MIRRARSHRLIQALRGARAARLLAVALVAAVGFAQFSASWHEASVRHVRCAEHGEVTHVVARSNPGPAATRGGAALDASEPGTPDAHEHCGLVFAVEGNAHVPVVRTALRLTPPPMLVRRASDPALRPGRASVLASAPKTSPPSA